jgi:hypothetical protein
VARAPDPERTLVSAPRDRLDPIGLPERLDRGSRLGPFPSGSAAVKFLLISALGALVALRFGPLLWPPFLGLGALLTFHRPDAPAADEKFANWLRWRWRRSRPAELRRDGHPTRRPDLARLADGRLVGGLAAGGIPLTFRPAADAARIFRLYAQWLRTTGATVVITVGRRPIPSGAFLPQGRGARDPEELAAERGYAELVRLLTRRRSRRRVELLLIAPAPGASGAGEMDAQLRACSDVLSELEVDHRRLRRGDLLRAVRELEIAPEGAA